MQLISRFILPASLLLIANSSFAQGSTNAPVALSSNSNTLVTRQPDSRGWTDPALNHNKLLISDGVYQQVGPFKVQGSQFLFGQGHKGDVFSATEKGYNIQISYDTYNQDVEFTSTANPDKPLIKEPGSLDSFIIHENMSIGISRPLKFVYGPLLGAKDKCYYEEICTGSRFNLYKRYKSELAYVSTNLGQSELREFDLGYEYFYTDAANKGVKKIKANAGNVISEFKSVKDLSAVINDDAFTANPEEAFCKAFGLLNATF